MRPDDSQPPWSDRREPAGTPRSGAHVLDDLVVVVVDDEKDARDAMSRTLREAGAAVMLAASGQEACDVLEAILPDVLVTDLVMPGLTGCDLMEVVRSNPRTAAIPAVAVTPDDPAQDREQAYTAGFDFLLAKPVEPASLVETVAAAAGRGPQTRE